MLQHLQIKNYALIKHLELNPDRSLNIITGETGAGKSIILGAIGLLLGNRMDTKALYNPDEKCLIEGHFNVSALDLATIFEREELDYEPISIIRREINPQGKSRAFINDTPVNLDTLRKIGEHLLDVHSQQDTNALASNEYQLQLIDAYAQNNIEYLLFKEAYANYLKEKSVLDEIEKRAKANKKDFDYNNFLYEELVKAKLIKGELAQIEQDLLIQENAEDVKIKLQLIAEYLYNADNSSIGYLEEAHANMNSISSFSNDYFSLKERLQAVIIELKDVFRETELCLKNVDYDQASIQVLQERINLIDNLLKKHSVKSEAELLEIQKDLNDKVEAVLNLDEDIAKAKQNERIASDNMELKANQLSKSRIAVFNEIENKIERLLKDLGIPNATLKIEHKLEKANITGIDLINFLFSANKGIAPQQLKMVASGGEFSRLMLAIKYILASKRAMPTIIFDEIDTGVSGEISIKVGKMMKEMAQNHQIIVITHLHQIAAQGNTHYYVYKDDSSSKTASKMRKLNKDERILEIAQMIGGSNPTTGILDNARFILEGYE